MLRHVWVVFGFGLALGATPVYGDERNAQVGAESKISPAELETARSAESLIPSLVSPSFQVRRNAFLQLWELGAQAVPALQNAQRTGNRQLAETANSLLLLNEMKVVRGNEQESSRLVELLNNLTADKIVSLCELGHWELATRLVRNNLELKQEFTDAYSRFAINRLVETAMSQGDLEQVWPIVLATQPPEVSSWIANKLELELPELDPNDVELQAVRLYFSGETAEAVKLPLAPNRLIPMLTRSFQWKEFSKPSVQTALIGPVTNLAAKAAQAVLIDIAGDATRSEELWAEILTPTNEHSPAPGDAPELDEQSQVALSMLRQWGDPLEGSMLEYHQFVVALLMSGRVAPVERYLEETNASWAYSFYASRNNFSKAFEQVGLVPTLESFDEWLEIQEKHVRDSLMANERMEIDAARVVGVLVGIGEHEKAKKLLQLLAKLARNSREFELVIWQNNIVRGLGRHESRALCMEIASENYDFMSEECQQAVVEGLFPELSSAAFELFVTAPNRINEIEGVSHWTVIEKLRLWDREFFGEDAENVISQWLRAAKQNLVHEHISSEQLTKLSDVARGFGYDQLALEILSTDLREFNGSEALNLHWLDAAEIYLTQFKPEKALELLSVLRQHAYNFQPAYICEVEALTQAGEYAKARELDRSRWLRVLSQSRYDGLSYSDIRQHFSDRDDVRRTLEYAAPAFLFAETSSRFIYWDAAEYAAQLETLDNYQLAADVQRAPLVEALQPYSPVVQLLISNGYFGNLRYAIQKERIARGIASIEKKDFEAARRHLDVSKSLQAQDIEVVVQCYPRLVEAGEVEFAEQLFHDYELALQDQIKAWPNDSTALNNLAWMYSQCNQKLDKALSLASRGVELAPNSPVFLDTRAEVEYRLGMVEKAIETMRNCVRIDPRSANYRANLVRFQKGPNQPKISVHENLKFK